MPGNKIKTKYLHQIDSVRKVNLSSEKIKLSEKVDGNSKEVVLKEKQNLKDKLYFEGILGVLSENFKMVQLSPALGYQMVQKYSMGLGPTLNLNAGDKDNLVSPLGLRSFAKYEIIKRKIYVQLENTAVPMKNREDENEGAGLSRRVNHSFMLGGGYLLHLNKSSSINLALLYRMNNQSFPLDDMSRLSFRLGVSSFGKSKSKQF